MEEVIERLLVDIILEIEVRGRAPHRQSNKDGKRQDKHGIPRDVRHRFLDIRNNTHLLMRGRLDTLLRDGKSNHKEHKSHHRKKTDGAKPAMLEILLSPKGIDKRQRQALHDKLSNSYSDKTDGRNVRALLDIAGHHATQRGVRNIIK